MYKGTSDGISEDILLASETIYSEEPAEADVVCFEMNVVGSALFETYLLVARTTTADVMLINFCRFVFTYKL